ncbi:MAG: hypothetical protein Kow0069_36810 [Promethearchaeota archaeon]
MKKIALFGLANAGKTSCLKVLRREFDVIANLEPTLGVERGEVQFFGRKLLVADFGGQMAYRERYLKSPELHFAGNSHLYYVVDVQDPGALKPAVAYFREVVRLTRQHSPGARFVLLFHKSDPGFSPKPGETDVKSEFWNAAEEVLAAGGEGERHFAYITSIHQPLTVVTAFTQPLFEDDELPAAVSRALEAFCKENGFSLAVLFSEYHAVGAYRDEELAPPELDEALVRHLGELDLELAKFNEEGTAFADQLLLSAPFELKFGPRVLTFHVTVAAKRPVDVVATKALVRSLAGELQKIFENVNLAQFLAEG